MWMAIIMALIQLLNLLFGKVSKKDSLTTKEQEDLNRVIYKMNAIKSKACSMGCLEAGTPDTFAGIELDPAQVANDLIDDAIQAEGYRIPANFNATENKGKLADLIAKLVAAGVTWDKIFGLVRLILPMIITGTIDWAALLSWIEKLFQVPVPNPGPLKP